jgi:hypothetical protein
VIQAAKKTTAVAFVTHAGSDGIDADEQSVGIAIDANVGNFQDMAAGLALFPKFAARAGKENHFAGTLREGKRFGTHEAQHQYFAARFILDNSGDQTAWLIERDFHIGSFTKKVAVKIKNRWALLRQRAKSVLISDLLTTPQRARRMAVMMMAMGVSRKVHAKKE